ncbi:MAG: flagellar biosynthetic protein FlhB [Myxococcales bacterium]
MAETPDGQEKTLEPTAKRREKAREEGQVAVSKDVNGAAQLLAASLGVAILGGALFEAMMRATTETMEQLVTPDGALPELSVIGGGVLRTVLGPLGAFCILVGLAALVAGLAQTRMLFSWKALAPKPGRLNPLQGIKNVFGWKALPGKLLLPVAKMAAGALIVALFIKSQLPAIATLPLGTMAGMMRLLGHDISRLLFVTTAVLIVLAVLDFLFQRHRHEQELKMTHEEHKRELIEQEGQPLIKGRRRQRHRELSLNRIIDAVPNADVVVTNPTHLAIALKYRPGVDRAPLVTAKGADHLALQIRRIARRSGVAIIENKPLARSLWRRVRVGQSVPRTLYQAVAEVLAHVFRTRPMAGRA